MKLLMVLKHPNIDLIADAEIKGPLLCDNRTWYTNVAICQWLGECVKIIPFKSAKGHMMQIPLDNIAMAFEADDSLAQIHNEEMKKYFESPKPFLSQSQYTEMMKKKQEKISETLGK